MRAHMRVQSEWPARDATADEWARIDPTVYVTAARRLQAQAMAEAIGAGWRGLRRAVAGLAALTQRQIFEPLARWSARHRAVHELGALDDRLLADIGLRRGDIELAAAGLLNDRRVPPRAPAAALTDLLLEGARRQAPAGSANSNQPAGRAQPDRVPDLAA
jgi:uncharacterized protein YjiS (DUF1127 family)